jgi:hypothetical protein
MVHGLPRNLLSALAWEGKMAVDERSRYELFAHLEVVLGRQHAVTLMEHLPPVGWADVATKQDVAHLDERLDLRLESFKNAVVIELTEKIDARFRVTIFSMLGALMAMAGLAFAR